MGTLTGYRTALIISSSFVTNGLRSPRVPRDQWDNTMRNWTCRHARRSHFRLDLVLNSDCPFFQSGILHDALQDRAARDTIRQVHLTSISPSIINFTISSIIVPGRASCRAVLSRSYYGPMATVQWVSPASSLGADSRG